VVFDLHPESLETLVDLHAHASRHEVGHGASG
jgi:hypothetical protein